MFGSVENESLYHKKPKKFQSSSSSITTFRNTCLMSESINAVKTKSN